jgi:hypothetical protein
MPEKYPLVKHEAFQGEADIKSLSFSLAFLANVRGRLSSGFLAH